MLSKGVTAKDHFSVFLKQTKPFCVKILVAFSLLQIKRSLELIGAIIN